MAKYTPRTEPNHELKTYPRGIPWIILNEGCERFSFYGMRAILYVYIVGLYINLEGMPTKLAEAEGKADYHLFGAAVYALPMIGAMIADRLLGKYKTIFWLSIVYCLGHAALALFESPQIQMDVFGTVLVSPKMGLSIGLALIAIGSGGIKPCVSANVGDQFGRGNWHLLKNVYNAFYFIINFGSAFATLIIPAIRGEHVIDPVTGHYSYTGSVSLAFAIPGILMALATIAFWAGRKDFVQVPPKPGGKVALLDVLSGTSLFLVVGFPLFHFDEILGTPGWLTPIICLAFLAGFIVLFAARQKIKLDEGGFLVTIFMSMFPKLFGAQPLSQRGNFFAPAEARFGAEAGESARAVLRVVSVFALVSVFWALFDQHSSTWIAQAQQMNRVLEYGIVGWIVTGSVVGALIALGLWLSINKKEIKVTATVIGFGVGVGLGLLAFFLLKKEGSDIARLELDASQVPALNPFMVMILIPIANKGLYPLFDKIGIGSHPLRRMTVGMFIAASSFVAVALLQHAIDAAGNGVVHIYWQMIPYLLITLAEVMVSITGLEFGYSQAPKRMKSVVMGFWLMTVAVGNVLVALLAGFQGLDAAAFFWVFAALMGVAALGFGVRAYFYKYRDVTQ
ncbi:MAG: hypothetical protein IT385_06950 [Deltaproteobacteria bacterium]|nr:hypothetical protein [Deltaproteobacteria bacterium]